MKKGLLMILVVIGIIGIVAAVPAVGTRTDKPAITKTDAALPAGYPSTGFDFAAYETNANYGYYILPGEASHLTWSTNTPYALSDIYWPEGHAMILKGSDFNYINFALPGSRNTPLSKLTEYAYAQFYVGADTCVNYIKTYNGGDLVYSKYGPWCGTATTGMWYTVTVDIPDAPYDRGFGLTLADTTGSLTTGTNNHMIWATSAGNRARWP